VSVVASRISEARKPPEASACRPESAWYRVLGVNDTPEPDAFDDMPQRLAYASLRSLRLPQRSRPRRAATRASTALRASRRALNP